MTDFLVKLGVIGASDVSWESIDGTVEDLVDGGYDITIRPQDIVTKGPWADVRAFGALGDGSTDDTEAIQDAIDSLGSSGGVVYLPPGIYIVGAASATSIFTLNAGVSIYGDGSASCVKIANNSATYRTIFKMESTASGSGHHRSVFKDFKVDHNPDNNIAGWSSAITTGRCTFDIDSTENFTSDYVFKNLLIYGFNGWISIHTSSESGVINTTVFDCSWDEVGRNCDTSGDHSCINVGGTFNHVIHNRFKASAFQNSYTPTVAIETHGISQVVQGNIIQGYFQGMSITGRRPGVSLSGSYTRGVVVKDNIMDGVNRGIQFWAGVQGSGTLDGTNALEDLVISGNIFRGDYNTSGHASHGAGNLGPLFVLVNISEDAKRVFINDNYITCTESDDSIDGLTSENFMYIRGATADMNIENLQINRNYMENCTGGPIAIYIPSAQRLLKKFEINDNMIVNPCCDSTLAASAQYVMYITTSDVESGSVCRNHVIEDRAVSHLSYGIYLDHITASSGTINILDNIYDCPNASSWQPYFSNDQDADTVVFLRQPIALDNILAANYGWAEEGSTYVDTENPRVVTRIPAAVPTVATWQTTWLNYGAEDPATALDTRTYRVSDVCYQGPNLAAGMALGWACISGGSPGTWVPFGQVGYRTNAGSPVGVLTPRYIGERVFDTTNDDWYTSTGTANTDWKQDSA